MKQKENIWYALWLLDSDVITINYESLCKRKKYTDGHTPCAGTTINHLLGSRTILVVVLIDGQTSLVQMMFFVQLVTTVQAL